ncbi:hypothetical protein GF406_19710 [candidate division KSB1 bacterium]|nr:hypothetical protein [candidate division KSB1 bacterium]
MQYSIIDFKSLNHNTRIDAEYFKPHFIRNEKLLQTKNSKKLKDYCVYIKKGIFDLSPENYISNGIPFIRTSEIKNPLINFNTTVFLNQSVHQQNSKTELEAGDLVFTKIGTYIGDIAILPSIFGKYNFSQNVTGAKLKNKDNSGYLLSYFLSKFGRQQIIRSIMLSGQGKLELEDIRNYIVVEPSNRFKHIINSLISKTQNLIGDANNIFKKAQALLLSELGLENWKPKHKLSYVRKYSDVEEAGRFDAEYFQPKYDEIVEAIKSYKGGWDVLGNVFEQNKSKFNVNPDNIYEYIEIGSVNVSSGDYEPFILKGSDLPTNAKIKLKKDNLVISKVRTYRGAVSIINSDKYVGSGAFTVLHAKGTFYIETLFTLLKSLPYLDFSLKFNTETSYPTLDEDILNYPIPLFNDAIQNTIKEKINESTDLRIKSKALLEIAKKGVEMAIEENEDKAEKWIKEEVEKLRVDI